MKCTYPDCNCPFDMGEEEKCLIRYEASGMSEFTELLEEIGVSFTVSADQSIIVYGYLDLEGTQITELPDNLSVGGSLYLYGTQITELPDNLSVGGSLHLEGTQITELPDNLSVGGTINLIGTQITELPDNLSVGGSLYLECTQITNVAYKSGCGANNRTIFAAWINREIQIGAGCFLGSLDKFFSAVDQKYSGPAAEQYKADAQDCVDRLTEILAMRQAG